MQILYWIFIEIYFTFCRSLYKYTVASYGDKVTCYGS